MKTLLIIAHSSGVYSIKATKRPNQSNYTTFVGVYLRGDKNPVFGKSFKDETTPEQIETWAKTQLNSINEASQLENLLIKA